MDHMNTSLDDIELDEEHDEAVEELNDNHVQPNSILPTVGMVFESVNQAKSFYRQYAISKGLENVPLNHNEKIGRPTLANDCAARMIVSKRDDKWYISAFDDVHSHDLSPTKSRLFRGNKRMNLNVKRILDLNAKAGVRMNKSYRSLVCATGGYEHMEFVEQDARNYVAEQKRALSKDGDAKALLNHFSSMREMNKDFFSDIDVDDDNRILNVFWGDARSRAACEYFGDVISFDTTYLTNKYEMSFAPFVGVNHHGQSILLGCGLLCSEDTDSFVWLFNSWLRCMSNRAPQGIITDQCKAMKKAIELVFPNTRHRWCLWHIMKKIPEKLQGYADYKDIKRELKQVVYNSNSVHSFVYGWERMITIFSLQTNEWLSSLYEERSRWVPCYLRNTFWADMSTTQRSEKFVKQYDNALQQKIEKEIQADFTSLNTTLPYGSQSLIERQFQKHYTHAKFAEIQSEFRGKINCFVDGVVVQDNSSLYRVTEDSIHNDSREERRVTELPSKYILTRWCKNVRRKHTYIRATHSNREKDPHIQRYDHLCKTFGDIAEIACESISMTELLLHNLKSFVNDHGLQITPSPNLNNNTNQQRDDLHDNNIGDDVHTNTNNVSIESPKVVKRKGRPRTKRLKSTCERLTRKTKSKKQTTRSSFPIADTMMDGPNATITNNIDGTLDTYYTRANSIEPVSSVQSPGFMSLLASLHNEVQNTQSTADDLNSMWLVVDCVLYKVKNVDFNPTYHISLVPVTGYILIFMRLYWKSVLYNNKFVEINPNYHTSVGKERSDELQNLGDVEVFSFSMQRMRCMHFCHTAI
ncbi:hypothetical protein V8G54_034436 [Vigna mungo]|uniref:Protein FAR1-RELATED SEQUENCE n=1 Tax=Vigna mungo TaxID=3915 RepID=A0AAQ3MQT9_VIGMU